jgi:hypothetical protein
MVVVLGDDDFIAKARTGFINGVGDDLQGRKQFIAEYGHAYLELADIS